MGETVGHLSAHQADIRHRVLEVDDPPPLGEGLERFLQTLNDDQLTAEQLESAIGHDQGLAARILKMANSAFYGYRGSIRTLSSAIVTLGFPEVKSLCLCALLVDRFDKAQHLSREEKDTLWKHAFLTGTVAWALVKKRPWIQESEAYFLGVLHDVGRLVLAAHFYDDFQAISVQSHLDGLSLWETEQRYGITHTDIGQWVGTHWGFPEEYVRVLGHHHRPDRAPSCRPECQLVFVADGLAHVKSAPQWAWEPFTLSVRRDLYIGEEEWAAAVDGMDALVEQVEGLWNALR
ncbi:HDOD domain-containing protein [Desulfoglaeba alkanexedens ALDC]|uniref:HDOD domain-containing protein n=1 Tax=Desulfoglaeba alkanexedens ALDC TaxID=980445 RepID=A0A4P8L3X1_9BACT|nr:HDOD domain-containing protein [Desulfoglaeba alkanexedens ALDC]